MDPIYLRCQWKMHILVKMVLFVFWGLTSTKKTEQAYSGD